MMRKLGEETGLDIEVHGPEASMTGIVARAIQHLQEVDESL